MKSDTTLSLSEARKKIFIIADAVQVPNVYYTFTDKGRPKAVLISAEEFECWQETLEVVKEFPDLKKDVQRAEADYKKGNYILLESFLARKGYAISDNHKSYDVSCRSDKKRSKKSRKN